LNGSGNNAIEFTPFAVENRERRLWPNRSSGSEYQTGG
jgi:hypothetical protein